MRIRGQREWSAILCATLFLTVQVRGVDVFWSGGGGDLQWTNSLNWTNLVGANVLPANSNRVVFVLPGYSNNALVHLGKDWSISEIRFVNGALPITITGDGAYSLTLTNGNVTKDSSNTSGGQIYTLDCNVNIGANALWQHMGGWASSLNVTGTVSDSGHGYTLTTDSDQNHNLGLYGAATHSGTTTVYSYSFTLGGRNGSLTNSDVWLMPTMKFGNADQSFVLDNSAGSNSDRFGDARTIRSPNYAVVNLKGHATSPVSETLGTLFLESGALTLQNNWAGTNVELVVSNLVRQQGATLLVNYVGGSVATNNKIRMQGESVNTNGIWRPWAIQRGVDSYLRVNASGCLIPLVASDYTILPASGSSSSTVYRSTNNLALTASQEAYGLRLEGTNTLDLGAYDFTIGSGAMLLSAVGYKTISASGGRLIFRGSEIIIAGQTGVASCSNSVTIHAPIACTGTNVYLCLPDFTYCDALVLDGTDYIGTYSGITAAGTRNQTPVTYVKLGGPSDRTINGPLVGMFNLTKLGPGTLRLTGTDLRFGNAMDTQGGRTVISNSLALYVSTSTNNVSVRAGGRMDVAAGITWAGNFMAEAASTIGGDGTFSYGNPNLIAGVHIAPGSGVGKLTTGNLTLKTGSVIDWELGNGTNAAGTDYDLLHVNGNLVLPGATSNMVLAVWDASAGRTRANGARFTVADWTGTTPPSTAQTWTITNASPATLDTSAATVQVNTTDKKIYLSGVKTLGPRGSAILVR